MLSHALSTFMEQRGRFMVARMCTERGWSLVAKERERERWDPVRLVDG